MMVQNHLERQLKVAKSRQKQKDSKIEDFSEVQKEIINDAKEYSKKMKGDPDFKAQANENFLKVNYAFRDTMKKNENQGTQGVQGM